jgi:hypothetical protein
LFGKLKFPDNASIPDMGINGEGAKSQGSDFTFEAVPKPGKRSDPGKGSEPGEGSDPGREV